MKRYIVAVICVIITAVFVGTTFAGEVGLKFGSSTITFNDLTTGTQVDVDYDYVVALYIDFVEFSEYSKVGIGPSFEIAYAKKNLGDELCWDGAWILCEEDFTYTGFEANLKATYGSVARVFTYGGISTNRIAIDYNRKSDGTTVSSIEKYYWGFQGAVGLKYVFTSNLTLSAEYKYKAYTDEELDHQQFITINIGYRF